MTVYTKMTKAELITEIDALKLIVASTPTPKRVERVPEAETLADCIRALDTIAAARRTSGYDYSRTATSSGEINRILRSLADKYHVPLVEVRHEPCDRPHLDQIDTTSIGYAVQQALSSAPGSIR